MSLPAFASSNRVWVRECQTSDDTTRKHRCRPWALRVLPAAQECLLPFQCGGQSESSMVFFGQRMGESDRKKKTRSRVTKADRRFLPNGPVAAPFSFPCSPPLGNEILQTTPELPSRHTNSSYVGSHWRPTDAGSTWDGMTNSSTDRVAAVKGKGG